VKLESLAAWIEVVVSKVILGMGPKLHSQIGGSNSPCQGEGREYGPAVDQMVRVIAEWLAGNLTWTTHHPNKHAELPPDEPTWRNNLAGVKPQKERRESHG
jgi:hypothetical protein